VVLFDRCDRLATRERPDQTDQLRGALVNELADGVVGAGGFDGGLARFSVERCAMGCLAGQWTALDRELQMAPPRTTDLQLGKPGAIGLPINAAAQASRRNPRLHAASWRAVLSGLRCAERQTPNRGRRGAAWSCARAWDA